MASDQRTSHGAAFNRLWAATGFANLGDGIALFTLPLLAIHIGASVGMVAAVQAALTLAWPIFGLHAGVIVDRADRRTLLATANSVRAVVLGLITITFTAGHLTLPLIFVAAFLIGVAETLVDTGLTSTVPMIVARPERARANGRLEATINVTNQLVGPPLAGLLAGLTLALATGTSMLLYLGAVIALLPLAIPRAQLDGPAEKVSQKVMDGIRFLWNQPILRTLTLYTAAMNVVWAAASALIVIYAVGPEFLALTEFQYGVILTGMAVGGIAAASVIEPLRARFGVTRLLIADLVGTVLLVAPIAFGLGVNWVTTGLVIAGAGATIWRTLVATIRQNLTPSVILGRVYSASRILSWGVIPVGAGLGGLAAEVWGLRAVFAGATVLAVVTLVAFIAYARRSDLSKYL